MSIKTFVLSIAALLLLCSSATAVNVQGYWRLMSEDSGGFLEQGTKIEMTIFQYDQTTLGVAHQNLMGTYVIREEGTYSGPGILAQGPLAGYNDDGYITLYLTREYDDPQATAGKSCQFIQMVGIFEETSQGLWKISGTVSDTYGDLAMGRWDPWNAGKDFEMWLVGTIG
jgi:hypothetical protein